MPSGGRAHLAGSGLRDCIAECSETGVITARPFLFGFETGTHLPLRLFSRCSFWEGGRVQLTHADTHTHTPPAGWAPAGPWELPILTGCVLKCKQTSSRSYDTSCVKPIFSQNKGAAAEAIRHVVHKILTLAGKQTRGTILFLKINLTEI